MEPAATTEIARVFREEYGRAVAVLVRAFGDLDIAEDAVQEAFAAAVKRWPEAGWHLQRAIGRLEGLTGVLLPAPRHRHGPAEASAATGATD